MKKCVTFNTPLTNDVGAVSFMCPACNKVEINRGSKAREIAAKYTCSGCGFEGPN